MSKKVLVISTSLRKNSNSDALAQAFAKGAQETGNQVEQLTLQDKTLQFCRGCLACQNTGRCVLHDDMDAIGEKMLTADVLVFATPVYFFEMCGQMKTLLDRTNPLYILDYSFRDVYLLAAAAQEEPETVEGTEHGLKGWIACFEKTRLVGTVFAGGVTDPGDMKNHPMLEKAYQMGRRV